MITPFLLSELISQLPASLAARLVGGDALADQFSTDTRTLSEGQIFVALRGERFDGHDHLTTAVEQGAVAVVVDHETAALTVPQFIVNDTLLALGAIAALNRQAFSGPVIGITGSSGKTSVRAMIAQILAQAGSVLATQGNLNNHIGVPLTLLRLQADHQYAVIEMGTSGAGEIAYLCELAKPTLTFINNVMPAHIQGFGSLDGVATSKGEIYQGLATDGVALINLDEPYAQQWINSLQGQKFLTFALENTEADAYARNVQLFANYSRFELCLQQQVIAIQLNLPGLHHVRNAIVAALAAVTVGADIALIAPGLAAFTPVAGRMVMRKGIQGCTVIDDSYNANPGSVKAAIDALALQPGKRVLVLGDMGELGSEAERLHAEVGEHALKQQIDYVFSQGDVSRFTSLAAGAHGKHYPNQQQLIHDLKAFADEQTVFLIKGSRSARTDIIAAALSSNPEACGELH